jgi:acyl-homoserine-lactone acylase
VPGKLDFYGDFRIGGPFTVIGGFNRDLGFATTNNASLHEFYALRPTRHAGPLRPRWRIRAAAARAVTVEYRDSLGRTAARRASSGPRTSDRLCTAMTASSTFYRRGRRRVPRGRAVARDDAGGNLEEWKDAMRIGARTTSNFTYADRAGNIFYVWVSGAPTAAAPGRRRHAGDSSRASDRCGRIVPFDSLPQLLNPPGGYVRNENDSPHYTNLNAVLPTRSASGSSRRACACAASTALELLHNDRASASRTSSRRSTACACCSPIA